MKHHINELYHINNAGYYTLAYIEAQGLTVRKGHRDPSPVYYVLHAMGDSKTIQDVDGKRTIYLYGEKTWFDTREERDAYRVERNKEREESLKRNKMLKEIMKHYEAMTTEELAEELRRMG